MDFDDVDLGWLRRYAKDGDLAEGFQLMADLAIAALESGAERSHERLFFAVSYAYRHSIELALKAVIRHGQTLEIIDEPLKDLLGRHDLAGLWERTRQVLDAFFEGDDPAPLVATERVVLQFDALDKSGQEFRYARDKRNRPHLANAPSHANLIELKRVMAGVGKFLECCSTALSVAVDNHEEMKRAYEAECAREQERCW